MKKTAAVLVFASVVLRLWLAVGYWSDKPLTQDAKEYLELANNFNATGEFRYDEHRTLQIESYGRAPGYPFWLAMLLRIHTGLTWIRLVEVAVSLVTTLVFFLLARELFGPSAAYAAAVLSSFYVPLLSLIPPILSENLWILLVLTSYLFLERSGKDRDRALLPAVFAFLFLAAATLVRPGAVFLTPFFLLRAIRGAGWKPAIAGAVVYFLALLPWNLHLYAREGRPIFVASEGGVTFWTGTHPQYSGDGDLAVNPPVQKAYRDILRQYADQSPTAKEHLFYNQGVAQAIQEPVRYLLLELKKLFYAFLPFGASVLQTSLAHRVTGIAFYLVLLIPALLAWRSAAPDARWLLAGVAASYVVMILLFFPQERFRIAVLDPVLLLLASSAIGRWFSSIDT